MNKNRKRILIHLHNTPMPVKGGDQRRLLGVMKYFRDRNNFFAIDAVGNNEFGSIRWLPERKQEVLKYVDNLFIYKGERKLFDFLYSRSQSFYYQKLWRQQLPIDSDYFTPPGYIKFVQNLITQNKYDLLWINYIEYAQLALSYKSSKTQLAIDIHDLGCQGRMAKKNMQIYKGLKFDYESNFTREVKLLNKFDTVIVNSQQELAILSSHLSPPKLCLVPHLVEDSNQDSSLPPYSHREFKYDLLFVGTGRLPNIDGIKFFLNSIFPDILSKKPDTHLALAGSIDQFVQIDPSLKENVDCLGYIPDLSNVYLKSRLVICPLLDGAGTKVKLQEAMAHGIPVVTTTIGASGMNLIDGVNAFITDKPSLFAHQVLRLLNEPELAQKLSTEIIMTFKSQYSNSAVYSKLDQMLGISPSQF